MSVEPLFQIRSGECGYGRVATDGRTGYSCPLTDRVLLPGEPEDAVYLSAHAPSRVEIDLVRPARVTGFLNVTARWMPENPAVFLINENPVGLAHGPLEQALPLTLSAGRHELRTACANSDSRHTVWRFDPVEMTVKPRLALMTIGCYPPEISWKPLWHLCQSAVKQDRWLHVMGIGTPYGSHYDAKIVRLREFVAGLDADYVLYTDGKDSILIGGEEEILAEFGRFGADFVIAMERGCWPIRDGRWREAFPRAVEERRWPNAGGWMGTKAGALRVLDRCIELREMAARGGLHGRQEPWRYLSSRFVWDDQALLQLSFLEGGFKGDTESRIFTNFGTADRRLEGNPHYEIREGRIRVQRTGGMPQVIHFSSPALGACRDQCAAAIEHRLSFHPGIPESDDARRKAGPMEGGAFETSPVRAPRERRPAVVLPQGFAA